MESKNENQRNAKKRSYDFAVLIIKFIDNLDTRNLTNQIIAKQLIRCSTSIGANIIEAQAGSSKKDFTNFFGHALKSANETLFWLNLLSDTRQIHSVDFYKIQTEAVEIAKILGASILTLRGKR
ncbi:MAG: four helix bundle protein [Candidatus Berkelbacteria bacterium]|nr:four helix bundle protein [Candidatus Berkelbacteria bacterium]